MHDEGRDRLFARGRGTKQMISRRYQSAPNKLDEGVPRVRAAAVNSKTRKKA